MRSLFLVPAVLSLVVLLQQAATSDQGRIDLRRAVPDDVFLVTHTQHNPERDYQRRITRRFGARSKRPGCWNEL